MLSHRKCRFVLCAVGAFVLVLLMLRRIGDRQWRITPHIYSQIVQEDLKFWESYEKRFFAPKELHQQKSESFTAPSSTLKRVVTTTSTPTTPSPWIDTCFKIFDSNVTKGHSLHGKNILEDVQQSVPQPTDDGRNIFFHETSCLKKDGIVRLNARQACAIESAARANPEWNVYVLFAAPVGFRNRTTQPILDALLEYPNVHLRYVNLTTYANDTPLKEWMARGEILRSQYMNSHLSDVMRYLTLYKYGGTYLDLDVIVRQSFEKMKPNYAGAESPQYIAAGVINFESKGHGHELAEMCVRDLLANYNGYQWAQNGPGVITRVLVKHCHTQSITNMTQHCSEHFTVYPPSAFYAIAYWNYKQFFEEPYLKSALEALNQSIVVHLWNKLSKDNPVWVGSRVPYGVLAERYCPKVYRSCGHVF
uniref:lactosylceramide 4-alpha-galactosyltransferase-like n=1 Tax=Anopheles coluzzii TaxID=1518534 RepID=UPI0020FFB61C|nr:lactosylceramide 4-alpha-galactosyltransferase-like [Anopheles coluzzii]